MRATPLLNPERGASPQQTIVDLDILRADLAPPGLRRVRSGLKYCCNIHTLKKAPSRGRGTGGHMDSPEPIPLRVAAIGA